MLDVIEEDRREREAAARFAAEMTRQAAEASRRDRVEARNRARREADAAIAELLKTHDRDAVMAFVRRCDPAFVPEESKEG
jgi:hypothetical protein